ncbi:MAG: hypothetical protein ACK5HR_03865 [Mycoplasmatales bacterium]
MVFGFLMLVAFFEVVSFPFIILQTTFTLYRNVIWILLILFYLSIFKICDFNRQSLKGWLSTFNKMKIMVYIIGSIVGVYVAVISMNLFDSWLYIPMILHPIQTNTMIYNTTALHTFDGYYRLLSFITYYSGKDVLTNYIFLMIFYKFFEVIMLLNCFGFIIEQIFPKKEKFVVLLMSIGLIWQIIYVLPVTLSIELLSDLYKMGPTGSIFLHGFIIPFLFIYLFKEYKSNKLLLLILLSGVGFSSSLIFIYPLCIVLYLGRKIFIDKRSELKDYTMKILMFLIPVYIYIEYEIIGRVRDLTNNNLIKESIIILVIFLIIALILYGISKLIEYIESKKIVKCNIVKNIFKLSLIVYILPIIIGVILNYNIIIEMILILLGKTSDINYEEIFQLGIYSILYIIGLGVVYKNKNNKQSRRLLLLHIITIVFIGNYLVYGTLGYVIGEVVFHRIMILSSGYIFIIIGIIFIKDIIFTKEYKINNLVINSKRNIYLITIIMLIINLHLNSWYEKEFYKFDEPFIEYKLGNEDVLELLNFDFQTPYIEIPQEDIEDRGVSSIYQIFELNTNLIYTKECQSNCYKIEDKEEQNNENNNIVYETTNYVVKYVI